MIGVENCGCGGPDQGAHLTILTLTREVHAKTISGEVRMAVQYSTRRAGDGRPELAVTTQSRKIVSVPGALGPQGATGAQSQPGDGALSLVRPGLKLLPQII